MVMELYTQVVCFHKSKREKNSEYEEGDTDENKVKYEGNNTS